MLYTGLLAYSYYSHEHGIIYDMERRPNLFENGLVLDYREFQIQDTKFIRVRYDIVNHIQKEGGINFLEIGTGSGDFADHICSSIKVNNLTIVDTFDGYLDHLKRHGGSPEDQRTFVENRFENKVDTKIVSGRSVDVLPQIYKEDPFTKYDFIYIDASHSFNDVMNDLLWSTLLLSEDGIIGLDDYCFKPPQLPTDEYHLYEVQQVLSAFLHENPLWKIKYFSLNAKGFQNVFICRDYSILK
jgi:hypothetical protein